MDIATLAVVEKLAWPVVALIGIIILGPMGLLEKLVKTISENVGDMAKAVADFRETVINIKPELERMNSRGAEISQTFRDATGELEARIGSLKAEVADISKNVSAVLRQVAAGDTDAAELFESEEIGQPTMTPRSTDEMLADIRRSWRGFVEALRAISSNPEDFDARMVGAHAVQMADGRRKSPIPMELAQEISALHSRYKRWMRLQSTKDEWLTPALYEAFEKSIEDVGKKLRTIPKTTRPRQRPR